MPENIRIHGDTVEPGKPTEISKHTPKDPFDYQAPTAEDVENISHVRDACKQLRDLINSVVPAGRARSVAITNLEQVSMWANKAIVGHGEF